MQCKKTFQSSQKCRVLRKGSLTIELLVSAILFGSLLSVTYPLLATTMRQQQLISQRKLALQILDNLAEQNQVLSTRPQPGVREWTLPLKQELQDELLGAVVKARVLPAKDKFRVEPIRLKLQWAGTENVLQNVSLTYWPEPAAGNEDHP